MPEGRLQRTRAKYPPEYWTRVVGLEFVAVVGPMVTIELTHEHTFDLKDPQQGVEHCRCGKMRSMLDTDRGCTHTERHPMK